MGFKRNNRKWFDSIPYSIRLCCITLGEKRLDDVERTSDPIDVSEFDWVLEFETCDGTSELLSGKIYVVRFRHNPRNEEEMIDEILDIQEFRHRNLGTRESTIEITKEKSVISYSGVDRFGGEGSIEFRLSTKKHFIELEAIFPGLCSKQPD